MEMMVCSGFSNPVTWLSLNPRYGRRRPTQLSAVLLLIFVPVAGMAPNIYTHLVSQFIVGAALGGFRVSAVVLGMNPVNLGRCSLLWLCSDWDVKLLCAATEWMGVARKGIVPCVMQLLAAVGQCIRAALVYAVPHWRAAQYVMAGAQSIVCLYIWYVYHTWLIALCMATESLMS